MMTAHERSTYTVRLQAGLGVIEETKVLLDLWHTGMDAGSLVATALQSGVFPGMSARRVHNLVTECFAPRYLTNNASPARLLKDLIPHVSSREIEQLMFIYTCRANPILADFVRDVYWPTYASSRAMLSNDDARQFVTSANQHGKTTTAWAEGTIRRTSGYLTGCCADFGLLEGGRRTVRRILPYELEQRVAVLLAYDLHLAGLGDNQVVAHEDWKLFGLEPGDVQAELKRMALKGLVIVQTAGTTIRIHWPSATLCEVLDGIAQGRI